MDFCPSHQKEVPLSTQENKTAHGSIEVSLPNGETRNIEYEVWQNMLTAVRENCGSYFEKGPKELNEAFRAFLSTGEGILPSTESKAS